eukprot:scaffold7099_cov281-Pinguiococcus_pyrenoidosus.AAC.16
MLLRRRLPKTLHVHARFYSPALCSETPWKYVLTERRASAELSVNATLKEEYKESEGTDSAAQEGPTEWRSDREALDKDKPLPDWSAGATSVQSSWTPRRGSVFEAVQRMEARRGSEGVMWLRISPISRLASRQDIALLVDKVLRRYERRGHLDGERRQHEQCLTSSCRRFSPAVLNNSERSELSDSAIKWFCLNPKKSEVPHSCTSPERDALQRR